MEVATKRSKRLMEKATKPKVTLDKSRKSKKSFDMSSTASMRTVKATDKQALGRQALMNLQDQYHPDYLVCRESE
jgi:hypothetical protein